MTKMNKFPLNVRLLHTHALLLNMIFILPVLVPYYRDVLGLGFREFMIGEALFSAVVILMEVPTGWLSDVWSRRRAMIAGTLVHLAGWTMLLFADGFAAAVAAQAVLGIGVSLFSGTNSALLYDSLLESGQERAYRRLEGLRMGIGLYGVAIASLLGGFLYSWHPKAPLIAVLVTTTIALCAALALKEPVRQRRRAERHPFADMAETMRYALRGHPEIAGIIVIAAILFAGTKMLMWTQQPYYIFLGLDEAWFGILMACGFVLGGMGGHFGHRFDGRFRNIGILLACIAFIGAACAIGGLWPGLYAIPLLLCGSPIFGLANPRVQDAINKRVGSERRATVLSTANLAVHTLSIPLMVLMGYIEARHGITGSLLVLAGILAAGAVLGLSLLVRPGKRRIVL